MSEMEPEQLYEGQKLQLKNSPSELVEFTGKLKKMGRNTYIGIRYPNGTAKTVLLESVLPVEQDSQNAFDQIERGCFGHVADLKRLITFEKLKGTLHEIIYSMEAAQVDFYPYQFKPVLKFISSPTQRMILADEVGLGKTIESGLIWMEMQARRHARRLLVICPPTLAEKWEMELRDKFLLDAQQVDFAGFKKKIDEFEKNGNAESFVLISTYSSLRPPKSAREDLRHPPDDTSSELSPKVALLQKVKFWNDTDTLPFDLVIFDEAHYMRNSSTASHMLGEVLAAAAHGVLCVSATPVNNQSEDLHSLLSLIDPDFFSSQSTFGSLMSVNKPTVYASTCLSRCPIDFEGLRWSLERMEMNDYVSHSPLFEQFKDICEQLENCKKDSFELVSKAQGLAEKLNILGSYINRTRRKQVEEKRPLRDPHVYTVRYNALERAFYNTIEENIRLGCMNSQSEFSSFSLITRQLMAASSLPAYAESLLGKQKDEDCLFEALGDFGEETDLQEEYPVAYTHIPDPKELAAHDSKFAALAQIVSECRGERIVIFAYYHATLRYLFQRLSSMGRKVGMIYGKNNMDERWNEIERFKKGEISILLSSEVGSEGIDLQCAHILINYDMPWNPMKVEQRIGRIDRVGQTSPVLKIINFSVDDTIEQRVYERLHEKLSIFSSTLGDMEAIIGRQVRKLTLDLFSNRLTPEQENARITQTAQALFNKMEHMRMLEEQSVELVGLSDYIQRKIEEDHGRGRYIRPEELEDYLKDFFGRYFRGTMVQADTPVPGCLSIHLADDARRSLNAFINNDRSRMAQDLRNSLLKITFKRNIMKELPARQRRGIVFINHLSPLIRWITSYYQENGHSLCRTSAISTHISSMEEGIYVFDIHLWEMFGISSYTKLAYGIWNMNTRKMVPLHKSEALFMEILLHGTDLVYHNEISNDVIKEHLFQLDNELEQSFYEEANIVHAENDTLYSIREQRIKNIFNSRIDSHKEILRKLEESNNQRMIPARKGLIRSTEEARDRQLEELKRKAEFSLQAGSIAVGIFFNSLSEE